MFPVTTHNNGDLTSSTAHSLAFRSLLSSLADVPRKRNRSWRGGTCSCRMDFHGLPTWICESNPSPKCSDGVWWFMWLEKTWRWCPWLLRNLKNRIQGNVRTIRLDSWWIAGQNSDVLKNNSWDASPNIDWKKLDIETLRKLDIDSIIQWGLLKLLDIEKTKNMATRKFLRDWFNDVQQRLIG